MNKLTVILISMSLFLVGCATNQSFLDNNTVNETVTPSPTPAPTDTPTPTPTEAPEDNVEDIDPVQEFTDIIAGVWGIEDGFFEFFEGTTIKRGEFGSDILPDAHIAKVTKLSDDKYEVFVEDRGMVDDPEAGFEYHGVDYTAIFDGSIDGFETVFIMSSGETDTLFLRMGDTIEEADKYYWDSFVDDYREKNREIMGIEDLGTLASGIWYTEDYDEINNWAGSYKLDLKRDGTAYCVGYRNQDSGTYKITGSNSALITFDHCEIDSPGEGWVPVDGFVYTVEMTIDGDEAQIHIDAPDVITNLVNGTIHRKGTYN